MKDSERQERQGVVENRERWRCIKGLPSLDDREKSKRTKFARRQL
jgi:hypothetical protein